MGAVTITTGSGATAAVSTEDSGKLVTLVKASQTYTMSYSIVGGADSALFSIDSGTGALSLLEAQPAGTYQVIVRATDTDSDEYTDQTINVDVTAVVPDTVFVGPGIASALLTQLTMSGLSSVNNCDEVWIRFRAPGARLDSIRLYHIYTSTDSGYNKGDGGTVEYSVYAHDEATNMHTGSALATTGDIVARTRYWTQAQAATKYPGAVWSQHGESSTGLYYFRAIDLTSPLTTTPGETYWIRVRQTNADKANNYIAIDNLRNRHQFIRRNLDPTFDNDNDLRVVQVNSSTRLDRSESSSFGFIAIVELIGDVGGGFAYYQSPNTDSVAGDPDRTFNIDGTKKFRAVWTPSNPATIKSVHIAAGKNSGTAPITVRIQQFGVTLATTELSGFPQLTQPSTLVDTIHQEVGWQSADLSNPVVSAGTPVYIEVSTASGTDYEVTGVLDGDGAYFTGGGSPTTFSQYTLDGSTWVTPAGMDMAFGLVVEES